MGEGDWAGGAMYIVEEKQREQREGSFFGAVAKVGGLALLLLNI